MGNKLVNRGPWGKLLHQARAILVIAWINGWVPIWRVPMWLLSSLVTPLSLLMLLTVIGGGRGLAMGALGGLVWAIASNGISIIADAAFYRLELRFQQMIVATPTSPLAYALGLSLSALVYSWPSLTIFATLLLTTHPPSQGKIPHLALSLALLWYSTSTMAFTASTAFKDLRYTWSMSNILSFVLGVLPPVYYPASALGQNQWLAYLVPTSAAAYVLHDAVGIINYDQLSITLALLALGAHAALGTAMVLRVARWRTP